MGPGGDPSALEHWAVLLDRLIEGDRQSFLEWSRRVTGWLAGWRAYDFHEDWDDLVQEVLIAAIESTREGRIRERGATLAYVRRIARHKFCRRLSRHVEHSEGETIPWEEVTEGLDLESDVAVDSSLSMDIRRALEVLPPPKGELVLAVYGYKRTIEQVAQDSGIPLGSVKRYLRQGLSELRTSLEAEYGAGVIGLRNAQNSLRDVRNLGEGDR